MTVVLIVDDEKALRESLAETVRDLGYIPVVASSGREALAVAARPTDVALLDLRMPDMDGLQVLRRLREAGSAPSCRSRFSPHTPPPPTRSRRCASARSIT